MAREAGWCVATEQASGCWARPGGPLPAPARVHSRGRLSSAHPWMMASSVREEKPSPMRAKQKTDCASMAL